ncbi:MAG: hypothetical protein ACI4MA_07435 [Treponema sp.]
MKPRISEIVFLGRKEELSIMKETFYSKRYSHNRFSEYNGSSRYKMSHRLFSFPAIRKLLPFFSRIYNFLEKIKFFLEIKII